MAQELEQQNGVQATVGFTAMKPQVVLPAAKADDAVQFYKSAFGAEEICRSSHLKRKADHENPLILCAELKIGSASFLVCDQTDESAPAVGKDGGIAFRLETENVEEALARVVKAGAVQEGEIVEEGVCGGVVAKVKDPFGVCWTIASAGRKAADVAA